MSQTKKTSKKVTETTNEESVVPRTKKTAKKVVETEAETENAEESDLCKRFFKAKFNEGTCGGRYKGNSPYQAACKAYTKIAKLLETEGLDPSVEIKFWLIETTIGSKKNVHQYIGKRITLEDPAVYFDKAGNEIVKNHKNVLRKIKKSEQDVLLNKTNRVLKEVPENENPKATKRVKKVTTKKVTKKVAKKATDENVTEEKATKKVAKKVTKKVAKVAENAPKKVTENTSKKVTENAPKKVAKKATKKVSEPENADSSESKSKDSTESKPKKVAKKATKKVE